MKDLRGKIALVTGSSRGIGPFICRALAREGAHVALAARSGPELERMANEIAASGVRSVAIAADVTDPAARENLVRRTETELGAIDILINNAGVERVIAFAHQEPADVTRILATNLEAPLQLTRLALPGMLQRRQGHIVTIASMNGHRGGAYQAAYSASKAGLIEWTVALRSELDGTGVSASVVCPGLVSQVGMWASYGSSVPWIARESRPDDVSEAVLRVLRRDLAEVNVNPMPVWPLLVLRTLSPDLANAVVKRIGLVAVARVLAERSERHL